MRKRCSIETNFLHPKEDDRRNYFMINFHAWDQAGIELTTPGSAVRLASVARHVTDCATRPSKNLLRNAQDRERK